MYRVFHLDGLDPPSNILNFSGPIIEKNTHFYRKSSINCFNLRRVFGYKKKHINSEINAFWEESNFMRTRGRMGGLAGGREAEGRERRRTGTRSTLFDSRT